MASITPNLKREKPLKVPMNDVEHDALRRFCARFGMQQAPFARLAVFDRIAELNRTSGKGKSEWPRHGHVQRFPGRAAAAAGGFRRLHL